MLNLEVLLVVEWVENLRGEGFVRKKRRGNFVASQITLFEKS